MSFQEIEEPTSMVNLLGKHAMAGRGVEIMETEGQIGNFMNDVTLLISQGKR